MKIENTKQFKSSKILRSNIRHAEVSLKQLPKKEKEYFSLQETIEHLRTPLQKALAKGYSYQDLVAVLQQQKIEISESTLRRYLSLKRRKASGKIKINAVDYTGSVDQPKNLGTHVEVSVNSQGTVSSHTVSRDFWNAYQKSLAEREEVYRRLAKS